MKNSKGLKIFVLGSFGFLVFVIVFAALMPDSGEAEKKTVQADPKELTEEEKIKQEIEDQFLLDGSHKELVHLIKRNMNDAESFEHVQTKYWIRDGGNIGLEMEFRGNNAMGAKVMSTVYAVADYETGEILQAEMEE